jgi:hypothetical protein
MGYLNKTCNAGVIGQEYGLRADTRGKDGETELGKRMARWQDISPVR